MRKGKVDMKSGGDDYEKMEEMKNKYEHFEMSEEQLEAMKKSIADAKNIKQSRKRKRVWRNMAVTAAAVAVFILLPNTSESVAHAMSGIPFVGKLVEVVTFRDYRYESERHTAIVTVPELVPETLEEQAPEDSALKKTTEEINAEIREISDKFLQEFEKNMEDEEDYQDILVKSEVINTTEDYFTLKLICYQGAGSGMEWNYFYTIDLNSGERLQLKDLFTQGSDYITPVSENIKAQMREQMAADENVFYWVDYEEVPDWNFEAITDETAFYVNETGNLVISFNEGDVAPMYMGVVQFVIPGEILEGIWK